ncbi:MAG UNVERIFIED_CONTAM: DUF3833 domain-containing protein [Rickettsiaceae bacterium]
MKKIKIILTSLLCLLLPGCGSGNIEYYANKKEKMDMREFFDGEIEGWGALFDIWGNGTRSFYVYIKGSWKDNEGILDEKFNFDDGEEIHSQMGSIFFK